MITGEGMGDEGKCREAAEDGGRHLRFHHEVGLHDNGKKKQPQRLQVI